MKILKEKRRFPRIDVELPIFIDSSCGCTAGKTLNISAGGAFIRCPDSMTIPERFLLAITNLPQVYLHLPVKAELIWSNGYEQEGNSVFREIGVEFRDISDADREFISALVSGYTEP
jgi:Tfp pilus assembly protein PilZ